MGRRPELMPRLRRGRPVRPVPAAAAATVRAVVREPLTRQTRREVLYCLADIAPGLSPILLVAALSGIVFGVVAPLASLGVIAAQWVALGVFIALLVAFVSLATRIARWLGAVHRRFAAALLGEQVAAPPAPPHASRGVSGWLGAGLRDRAGWRAVAYMVVKVPLAVFQFHVVVSFWAAGLANVTFPFWWRFFRNHPPGVRLSPVPVLTPFGVFHVSTFANTFLALAGGVAMLLAAPWVTRAVVLADVWLMRGLLGPGRLAQRVRDLEQTRAFAVDDSAALLRKVERDLHDGAQVRLATLAMNLGMAKEKLGSYGDPPDVSAVRELVDAAHQDAKEALIELRDLARGIHPPVLDNGLADALATLAASSPVPVELSADIAKRPTQAIETIAYFCAAELLANAVKHSFASMVRIHVSEERGGMLVLRVADDGRGGAGPANGSGLSGLAQRVSTVDGRLEIDSPPGGPTHVTVRLPLRA